MNRIKAADRILAEELIDSIMKDYDACGLAACIIDGEGNTQYECFRGTLEKGKETPVNGDTIFGLASLTKSFTAMAVMMMQERGLLSVHDPVSAYLPAFTNKNTDTVTIGHLLTHTGGFFPLPRITADMVAEELGLTEEDGDLAFNRRLAEEGGKQVAERLDSLTMENGLNGRPGEYLSYCNDGFGLLSEIIRLYDGCDSYAGWLRSNILSPLGMDRSGCDFIKPAEDDNAAVLYEKKDGVMQSHRNYRDNAFVLNGGGAMKSTLNDLKKYLRVYLKKGDGLLSSYSIREMCKGRIPYHMHDTYGYGLYNTLINGMTVTGHGGSLPGVSSNIAFTFDNDCAVIVLCNTSDVPVSVISDALIRMYAGDTPLPDRTVHEHPWSEETVTAACGSFASGEGTSFEIFAKEDGTPGLRSEEKELNMVTVSPEAAVVRGKYSDTPVKLIRDEKGHVFAVQYGSRLIPRASGNCS